MRVVCVGAVQSKPRARVQCTYVSVCVTEPWLLRFTGSNPPAVGPSSGFARSGGLSPRREPYPIVMSAWAEQPQVPPKGPPPEAMFPWESRVQPQVPPKGPPPKGPPPMLLPVPPKLLQVPPKGPPPPLRAQTTPLPYGEDLPMGRSASPPSVLATIMLRHQANHGAYDSRLGHAPSIFTAMHVARARSHDIHRHATYEKSGSPLTSPRASGLPLGGQALGWFDARTPTAEQALGWFVRPPPPPPPPPQQSEGAPPVGSRRLLQGAVDAVRWQAIAGPVGVGSRPRSAPAASYREGSSLVGVGAAPVAVPIGRCSIFGGRGHFMMPCGPVNPPADVDGPCPRPPHHTPPSWRFGLGAPQWWPRLI
jgi:hypothetical protein